MISFLACLLSTVLLQLRTFWAAACASCGERAQRRRATRPLVQGRVAPACPGRGEFSLLLPDVWCLRSPPSPLVLSVCVRAWRGRYCSLGPLSAAL